MRIAPEHVAKALRAYDPHVRVEWDESLGRWLLWWRDRRVCRLEHRDGSPMVAELIVEEIMEIVARADNHRDGPERLREIERNVRLHDERAKERTRAAVAETTAHASEAMDVELDGPRPFVHIQNNPLKGSTHHVA